MCERSDTAGCEARWRTGSGTVDSLGGRSAGRSGGGGTVGDIKGYYPISKDIKGYYSISNSSILLGIPSKRLFFLARASKERKVSPNV